MEVKSMSTLRPENKDELIKKLENIEVPELRIHSHQRWLRLALLNSGYFKEKSTMNLLKKSIPVGGVIAIIAIIAVFGLVFKGTGTEVSAKEIAQRSFKAVSSLTPAQQESLRQEHHLTGGPEELLNQAQNAEDLKVLSYDEFVSQYENMLPPPFPGVNAPDMRDMTFLKFTGADGATNIIGISNEDNLPVLAMGWYMNDNPDENPAEAGTTISGYSNSQGAAININGKVIQLPAGTDPGTIEVRDGKVYVNGQEVSQ
jgi:hypothetical protein